MIHKKEEFMSASKRIRVVGKPTMGTGSLNVLAEFSKSDLESLETPFGNILRLKDGIVSGEPGTPGFPSQLIQVALPAASDITKIKTTVVKEVAVTKKPVFVAPIQEHRPALPSPRKAGEKIKRSVYRRLEKEPIRPDYLKDAPGVAPLDIDRYKKALASPAAIAEVTRIEHTGAATIATLQITPAYQDSKGLLKLCTQIKISITYESAKSGKPRKLIAASRFYKPLRTKQEALRIVDIIKSEVVNPDWVIDISDFLPLAIGVDYLIITDKQKWNADTITPGGSAGDLPKAFESLAIWKKKRGLRTKIVTITDIVNGNYGDFKTGARDLQEVIRNFLKWAYSQWNVSWVLLGGDIDIIPIRLVAGAKRGYISTDIVNPPENNKSFWTGNHLRMHVVDPGEWWGYMRIPLILINPADGTVIPYDAAGTSSTANPGWYYTTDNNYNVRSTTRTDFIRANGPAALLNTRLQFLYRWNRLATDLYYSSLVGPDYGVAGTHDWDLVDNEVYGQHTSGINMDGVNYNADVGLGRAPVSSVAEVEVFVKKVISYEQFRKPDGTLLSDNWPRKLTLVSANFGHTSHIGIGPTNTTPPPEGTYYHGASDPHSLLHLKEVFEDMTWRLLVQVTTTDIRIMPYEPEAAVYGRGWHFAISSADLNPSEMVFTLNGHLIRLPVPTEWVVVYGYSDELTPQKYIFDRTQADSSQTEHETLRKQIAADFPGINVVKRLYQDEIDLPPADATTPPVAHLTQERVRDSLNNGPHFLSLSGHGSQNGCCYVDKDMARNATNAYHTFIAYANSCLTNDFEWADAMSEELIKNANGGAVAYVGYTRFGWLGLGDDYEREFFKRLKTTRHLSLLNDSRFNRPSGSVDNWTKFSLNILGDPEMPVWVGKPGKLNVSHPSRITKGQQVIQVNVKSASNVALKGAVVCLSMGDGYVVTETTDASGNAYVHMNITGLGKIEVVVTATDYIPYFGSIQVTTKVVCKLKITACLPRIICAKDITLCRLKITCGKSIICKPLVACSQKILCKSEILPCQKSIACNLKILPCKAAIGPICPIIYPVKIPRYIDIFKACGVKSIGELAKKMNTVKVKNVLAKLSPANRKALTMMLKRIRDHQ
jgi:hypothetical protein